MMKTKSRRAINIPGNDVGKLRYSIYRSGHLQIKRAISNGFYLEAISLCESLISDRLEARRAWIHNQAPKNREFQNLGFLARALLGHDKKEKGDCLIENYETYRLCLEWSEKRNVAVHQMFKLPEDMHESWDERYLCLEGVAKAGVKLARKVSAMVKNSNRNITDR